MKTFVKIILFSLVVLVSTRPTHAGPQAEIIVVPEASMSRLDSMMNVSFILDFSSMKIKSTGATIFTPLIINEEDTLALSPLTIYGRTRWFQTERAGHLSAHDNNGQAFRYSKDLKEYDYSALIPYREWMNGSELMLQQSAIGCAGCSTKDENLMFLASYAEPVIIPFRPVFIYKEAQADAVKIREISGRAFVDFPVNQTVIYPDYRNNTAELRKITATIDSVRNDKDITVTSLSIKGFASPEGSYSNNERLAKGRTEALKNYVENLYHFPTGFIKTSYEPEDWEGLKAWVETSSIANKEGILAIIDSNLAPDPKNTKIQTTYPQQYKWLLANVYPGLRHSDYRIEFTIRQFSDVREIAEILKTSPQKLSLNEMYLLSKTLEPGSDEYNEIFEIAVRMYPEDETANLNAANTAMRNGQLESAGKYLLKAGSGPEATFARGMLAAFKGDKETAENLIRKAGQQGIPGTEEIIAHIRESEIVSD